MHRDKFRMRFQRLSRNPRCGDFQLRSQNALPKHFSYNYLQIYSAMVEWRKAGPVRSRLVQCPELRVRCWKQIRHEKY